MKRNVLFLSLTFIFCSVSSFGHKLVNHSVSRFRKGVASYYSDKLNGHITSSGSLYHKDSLTCAYRSLPFGTLLKVRNPLNNKEVVVKVTDRGPFKKNRVIDLSYAAARELRMVDAGVMPVEITPYDYVWEMAMAGHRWDELMDRWNVKEVLSDTLQLFTQRMKQY
jgi:rare lipoprotein A (peptidoglycan hydrolase)